MSSGNLRRRKLRTFLTVLGVVIGTTSVVTMLSLGLGMQKAMYQDIENYGGLTTLTVSGSESTGSGGRIIIGGGIGSEESASGTEVKHITDEKIEEIKKMEHVQSVFAVYQIDALLLKGNYETYAMLKGMTPEGLESMKLNLEWGEMPLENTKTLELIFGNTVPTDFYNPDTGEMPYYEKGEMAVDLKKDAVFLITDMDAYWNSQAEPETGIGSVEGGNTPESLEQEQSIPAKAKKYSIKAKGLLSGGPENWSMNSMSVFCDLDTLINVLEKEYKGRPLPGQPTTSTGKPLKNIVYSNAEVKVDNIENAEALAQTLREKGYSVSSQAEWIEQMKSQMTIVQAVLGGIGAVSLLVAAIGIANTMMMAIYERTREIGVMKVIGCSLKNIRQLFLIEAASIGLIGGIVGVIFSFGVSAIVNMVTAGMVESGMGISKISFIPPWIILVALGIATFVGIAAGYFPALRAMKLSPLAAIRNE